MTIDTFDTVKVRTCIVSTVTLKTKSIRPRNKSHSCFTCHRLTFLDCFYSYSIAAKLLKVKDFLLFLGHNPKHFFQWFRRATRHRITDLVASQSIRLPSQRLHQFFHHTSRLDGCASLSHRLSLTTLNSLTQSHTALSASDQRTRI